MEVNPMSTDYAKHMVGWKKWMKEYQYGIVLIIPPEPHKTVVNALRQAYAWSQSSQCDAHISLSVPVPGPVDPVDLQDLETRLANFKPFHLNYGPIITGGDGRGIVLDIEPQETLKALLALVEGGRMFQGASERKWPYLGHLTIAEMLTTAQSQEIRAELSSLSLSGQFLVDHLSYVVPDENFAFTERAKISIGRDCKGE
jgi:2'-5' RNA ligase